MQEGIQHNLEERLPEGFAIQWETCGPKIQGNPMGFTDITGMCTIKGRFKDLWKRMEKAGMDRPDED